VTMKCTVALSAVSPLRVQFVMVQNWLYFMQKHGLDGLWVPIRIRYNLSVNRF
jgi:hypothetical protein